jgi:hypothetical protein
VLDWLRKYAIRKEISRQGLRKTVNKLVGSSYPEELAKMALCDIDCWWVVSRMPFQRKAGGVFLQEGS